MKKKAPNSVVHLIRRSPLSNNELAERFGVHPRTVSSIRKGRDRFREIVTPGWSCDWPRERDTVMAKVDGSREDEHWIWKGQMVGGMPVWRPDGSRRMLSARKYVWILHRGPYEFERYQVKPRCRAVGCVNPWHAVLELHPTILREYTFHGRNEGNAIEEL